MRRFGFAGGGTWSAEDTSSMNGANNATSIQLDFESYPGGGIPAFVRFAIDPLKLDISAYPGVSSE